jgi:hypothetical protein
MGSIRLQDSPLDDVTTLGKAFPSGDRSVAQANQTF